MTAANVMTQEEYQPAKGTRDIAPEELSARMRMADILSRVVETYGFRPLDTPAFENFGFLAKKSGPDVKGQIYYFKDKADRELGLRFDLTVPIVRFLLNNPALPKPIRLYSIGKVWRYEDTSSGRFREFSQLDVELVGSSQVIVDAETIACAVACLRAFGLERIRVKINVKEIIAGFAKSIGIAGEEAEGALFRAIDKREKLSDADFRKELSRIGIAGETAERVKEFCSLSGEPSEVLDRAEKAINQNALVAGGMAKLRELIALLRNYGIADMCEVDFSVARGIDYYTGIIFEIKAGSYGLSVVGGGRYDELIGLYGGEPLPATGFGMGIDRLYEILEKEKKLPAARPGGDVLVVPVNAKDAELLSRAISVSQKIREAGVPCELDVMDRNIGKNLEFADKTKMPFVVIIGEKELAEGLVKVKEMKSGDEKLVKIEECPFYIAGKAAAKKNDHK